MSPEDVFGAPPPSLHLLRRMDDRLPAWAIENRAERGQKMPSIDYAEVLRERMIVGTPQRAVDQLRRCRAHSASTASRPSSISAA